jgi:hypothetical protein
MKGEPHGGGPSTVITDATCRGRRITERGLKTITKRFVFFLMGVNRMNSSYCYELPQNEAHLCQVGTT